MANFTKELKELRKLIESTPGYRWEVHAKKYRVYGPNGSAISISKTPSATNALRNIRGDLKRIGIDWK